MKKLLIAFAVLFTTLNFAQQQYKYVILQSKFEFLRSPNEYNLNSLTKSFFESEGFTVFYDTDELPIEIANNRCNALYPVPVNQSKLFTTYILFEIRDCQNKVLYESFRGNSREKSYEVAYRESFRTALTSMKGQLKFENKLATNPIQEKVVEAKVPVQEVATPTQISENGPTGIDPNLLQPIETKTGFNLVDYAGTPRILLQKTSMNDVFLANSSNATYKDGVLIKKNNEWFLEYYYEDVFFSEKVNVRF